MNQGQSQMMQRLTGLLRPHSQQDREEVRAELMKLKSCLLSVLVSE